MRIYQLHEYCGEWEDYRDLIRGSYLRRERAEEEKVKREAEQRELERRSDLCANCLFIGEDASVMEKLLSKYPDYCDKKEFYIDTYDNCIECENYYLHYDKSTFNIKEVEVEE